MALQKKHFLFLVLLCLNLSCVQSQHDSQAKLNDPNWVKGRYINNHIEHPDKDVFAYLKLRWFGEHEWADHEKAKDLIPTMDVDRASLSETHNQVTWLGHSTFLIQFDGVTILTDPIFSKRASPVSFAGPKRYTDVAMEIEELPSIDLVIISHNHYDHLDKNSIQALGNDPHYIVPSGLKAWFTKVGINAAQITELKWWASTVEKGMTITATPSQHWSARGLGDKFKTHWASWLLTSQSSSIWFAGDTGYNNKDFVAIGDYAEAQQMSIDLALIPIGAYGPRSFMKAYHVNPEEAVQIHKDIGAKYSIGMHWGAFPLTSEWPMEPYERLNKLRQAEQLGAYPFTTMKIGETTRWHHD